MGETGDDMNFEQKNSYVWLPKINECPQGLLFRDNV